MPASSLKELAAWVKADPARAVCAVPSIGTLPHFLGVLFGRAAGLDLRHVGYRGSAAAIVDLAAGQIPIVILPVSDVIAMHNDKRARIIATAGRTRSPFTPDVPTLPRAGVRHRGHELVRRVRARARRRPP